MKTKRIYKRAMAEHLIDCGCICIKTSPDLLNLNRINWIFEDTELLRHSMETFPMTFKKEEK